MLLRSPPPCKARVRAQCLLSALLWGVRIGLAHTLENCTFGDRHPRLHDCSSWFARHVWRSHAELHESCAMSSNPQARLVTLLRANWCITNVHARLCSRLQLETWLTICCRLGSCSSHVYACLAQRRCHQDSCSLEQRPQSVIHLCR